MPFGTAANRLRKAILFDLVCRLGLDVCHHCEKKIEDIDNFSIEHKTPWLDSDDPVGLFFDMENIAFSHLKCNSVAGGQWSPGKKCGHASTYRAGCRCDECQEAQRAKWRRNAASRRART